MIPLLAVADAGDGLRIGLIVTTFAFGLRHGVDWDHIAAIADITSSANNTRRSMVIATLYATGHAAVVLALGLVAILGGDFLPDTVDSTMERIVGVTLVVLGVYVFYALVRYGREFRMRSRWMLVLSGIARAWRWLTRSTPPVVEIEHDHEHGPEHGHPPDDHGPESGGHHGSHSGTTKLAHRHTHRHHGSLPDDPFGHYGDKSALFIGMLHGVGAETPTQLLVFLAAAKAGGTGTGIVLLFTFILGLLVSNSAIAVATTLGFLNAGRRFGVYATVAVITGVFSLGLGILFLLGRGDVLPAFFAG